MSTLQPNEDAGRVSRGTLTAVKAGIGLLAAACVVLALASGYEWVRDAADRTH